MRRDMREEGRRERRRELWQWRRLVLILCVLAVAGVSAVLTGGWLADRRAAQDEERRLDEHVGLGERTGMTGDLALHVDPLDLAISPGQDAGVNLTLTNKTSETMMLNAWFTPAPADFGSNQLPLKMIVSTSGRKVGFIGDPVLFPPHRKSDFIELQPGQSKVIPVELSRSAGMGRWDMSAPGDYTVELWYETYLTGRYIGVNAWTGMTNHVVVRVTVRPQEAVQ